MTAIHRVYFFFTIIFFLFTARSGDRELP